jgi:hypothetical protein
MRSGCAIREPPYGGASRRMARPRWDVVRITPIGGMGEFVMRMLRRCYARVMQPHFHVPCLGTSRRDGGLFRP